jgi:hypothetical protein
MSAPLYSTITQPEETLAGPLNDTVTLYEEFIPTFGR